MKKGMLFAGVAFASLALASCGGGNEAPSKNPGGDDSNKGKVIELTYSGAGDMKEYNKALFEDFKAARKAAGDKNTYEIDYVVHGADKVDSEIVDFSDANAPDVFEYASDKIGVLYSKGALSALSGKYEEFVDSNFNAVGQNNALFNNKYYGYTFTGDNTYYFQYDKRYFTEKDVESIEGILAKAQEQNVKIGYPLETAFWSAGALFTFGADYDVTFDEDGNISKIEADFNTEKGIKAIKAIKMILEHPAYTNAAAVPSEDNGLAGCIEGTWNIASYRKALGENYGCAPMPTVTIDGETRHLGCFAGGKLLGVNPQRSNNDKDRFIAAHELAMFLSGAECQKKRFLDFNIGPCHNDVLAMDEIKTNENIVTSNKQYEFAHLQGAVPGGIWNAPSLLVAGLIDGTYHADNLQEAADALNKGIVAVA